jgi:pimeloyl-ACP methyl ester carboxylesterase
MDWFSYSRVLPALAQRFHVFAIDCPGHGATYRRAHPEQAVEIGLVRNDTVRLFLRGMDQYDPRFGAGFHDGTWNTGFDNAEALAKISCPVLLVHAAFSVLPDGTLNGAMSQEEADKAASLLPNGSYRKVDATHVVHLADPDLYIRLIDDFLR